MKTAFTMLVVIIAVLACGCTAAAPAASSPPAGIQETAGGFPSLTGTWTGPMQGYDAGTWFPDYPDLDVRLTVTGQKGRIFAGDIVFIQNGTETKEGFAGVIGRDGRTLAIAEEGGGYCTGTVLGADEIELIYMQDGPKYSVAIDSFKRVESHQT